MALSQGPSGDLASAYQSSPCEEGFPAACMKTVTQRLRNGFHAIEPLCSLTACPSLAETRLFSGASVSQLEGSCHASKVASQRKFGSGLPKSTNTLFSLFVQNAG